MTDSRFFTNHGPFTAEHLAGLADCELMTRSGGTLGPADKAQRLRQVHDVSPLDTAGPNEIGFLDLPKYNDTFRASKAGFCLVRPKQAELAPEGMVLLVTPDPHRAYAMIAQAFYPAPTSTGIIAPQAVIDPSAEIGANVQIDPYAVIGPKVRLGAGCIIGPGTVIERGVQIGEGTRIGAHNTLSHCVIGARVLIHHGVHIGQDGFGFASSREGHLKVPQLGRVIVEDEVEIGSGTCIDRGAGPDTLIGQGSKIDNLVMLGHNVTLGRHCILVSQVGIAGSTRLGDFVVAGGQAGLAGHLEIGSGARLAARVGLMHDVPAGATFAGSPAVPFNEWRRQTVSIMRLGKKETKEKA